MMFFNPLFLQVINNQESLSTTKAQKLNGSSYLFSDIIKVCFDKSEAENINSGSEQTNISSINSLPVGPKSNASSDLMQIYGQPPSAELTLLNLMQNILPQKFDLTSSAQTLSSVNLSQDSSQNVNSLMLNESEITSLISKLLNNNYQGKVNILSNKNELKSSHLKSANFAENDNLSPDDLLELLKQGNAVALENSGSENNPGLLISLVEVKDQASGLGSKSENDVTESGKNIFSEVTKPENTSDDIDSKNTKVKEILSDNSDTISTGQQTISQNIQDNQSLYQVELSIIKNNNSDLQFPSSNYIANTDELQELTKNKGIKFPDNYEMDQGKSLNSNPFSVQSDSEKIKEFDKTANSPSEQKLFTIPNNSAEQNQVISQSINSKPNLTEKQNIFTAENNNSEGNAPISQEVLSASELNSNVSKDNITSGEPETEVPKSSTSTENGDAIKQKDTTAENNISNSKSEASTFDSVVPEEKSMELSEDEIQKSDPITQDVKNFNSVSAEIKPTLGKKSGIIKDINLSIKSSKLKKEEQTITAQATEQTITDTQKNKPAGKDEFIGINHSSKSVNDKVADQQPDIKKETNNINQKADAKQATEIGISSKEKGINPLGPEKSETKNETESVKNSGGENTSKDNGSANKDSNHQTQEQQPASSTDKNDFRSKIQENHITGNDITRNTDNTVKEKIPFETKNFSNPVRTVKAAEIMKEISGFIQQNNDHTLTLKIDPENLGTVKIAIDVVDKMIHANIEVENDAAKKMVETNLNQLYNSLSQNGVQINSLNISMANYDQKQNKGFSPKKKIFQSTIEEDYDDKNVSESRKMGYNTYEYLI